MTDCLFLAPGGRGLTDSRLYWQPTLGNGCWIDLPALSTTMAGVPLALILPGEHLSACAVALPTTKARWLRQALQYAVEEQFTEDVEQLHLATGPALEDGRTRVLAVRRDLLTALLTEARSAGLQIKNIHADFDLLPADGCQVLLSAERGLVGGAVESRLVFASRDWPLLKTNLASFQLHQPLDPFAWQAQQRSHAIDLAQGEFAMQPNHNHWQAWKPVVGVLGLWLVLQLLFDIGQVWYFERQGNSLQAQSQALYQQLFPQDTRIVNLKAQFAEHLKQATDVQNGRLLSQLAQLRQAIGQAPLQIAQVTYSQERGSLAVEVHADTFAQLEQLRLRLAEYGLSAHLGSASRDEKGVSARIVIGEAT
jgi:general secretion pathway protein L